MQPLVPVTDVKAVAEAAALAVVPAAANATPPETGTKGAAGTKPEYARADHTHEVRARRKRVALGTDGTAKWVFDKPFGTKPIIVCSPEDDGGLPVVCVSVKGSWTQDANGLWTGVTVKGVRAQNIPQNLVNLLLGGVFNLFAGTASGVTVGLTAAEETPVAV
ncbi:hypothetical protein [Methylorubrum zatmanii]